MDARRLLWLGRLTAAGAALLPFTGAVRPGGPLSCCLLGLAVVLVLLGSAGGTGYFFRHPCTQAPSRATIGIE